MKKLSIIAVLVMAGCCLTGCVSNQDIPPAPVAETNTDSGTNPYHITEEEALANLDAFFAANNQSGTRTATAKPRVKSIKGIRDTSGTRSEGRDSTILLYIANFDEEQGFALLSADKRVSSLVLGVSEQGGISEEVLECYDRMKNKRPLYKGFPLDGPGFFTDTISGGGTETFINPNTVDFYIEEEGEYLIGNLDTSEYELLNQYAYLNTSEAKLETFILSCVIDYAQNRINHHDDDNTDLKFRHTPDEFELADPAGYGGYWETDVVINGPLLSNFVKWEQSPYLNVNFPIVKKFLSKKSRHASTGCFPLALAKILAYNRIPEVFTYHDHTFDWNIICNDIWGRFSETALFLRAVADGCNPWYFYEGTFVFPYRARKFLSRNGYAGVENIDNSFDRIKEMIDNNHPLAISGMPGIAFYNAHAWNIDGYRTSKYGGRDIKMVHCDFG